MVFYGQYKADFTNYFSPIKIVKEEKQNITMKVKYERTQLS